MNPEIIHSLTTTFEAHAQQTEGGVEYWLARDLQFLLGYAESRNFKQSAVSKAKIAFAQTYFAVQTRRAELIEKRLLEAERIHARKKLSATEKELSVVIFEQTGGNDNFAIIRSKGDQALFGKSTQAMKSAWKVPDNRPLADLRRPSFSRPRTSPPRSPSSTSANTAWPARPPFPASMSPTTKPSAKP